MPSTDHPTSASSSASSPDDVVASGEPAPPTSSGVGLFPFDPDRPEAPTTPGAVSWSEFVEAEPDLGGAVAGRFGSATHHVLATLRRDGSPRVSGTEVLVSHGVLSIGSMWLAVKALDLRRDGRFALHSNPGDGSMEDGDAKVSGVAVELGGQLASSIAAGLGSEVPEPFHLFRLDITQVVLSEVDRDRNGMVVRSWWPERGLVSVDR